MISPEELQYALDALALGMAPEDLRAMLAGSDMNDDGFVNVSFI